MFEKRDIKDFLIAAKDELPKEERLKVVRHFVEDLSGGVNTLKEEVGELFSEELTVERVDAFVNFLKKNDEAFPGELVPLGNLLRNFVTRSETGEDLNEKEQTIVSIAIKYFENWMMKGGFLDSPEYDDQNIKPSDYLATACFLVNQLAKIKEKPSHENVNTISAEKLGSLFTKADEFQSRLSSGEKEKFCTSEIKSKRLQTDKIDTELFHNAEESRKVFEEAKAIVVDNIRKILGGYKGEINIDSKVVGGMLGENLTFVAALRRTDSFQYYREFDLSSIDFAISTELGSEYRALQENRKELEKEKENIEKEISNIEIDLGYIRGLKRSNIYRRIIESRNSVMNDLRRPAGEIYFLKTLIICAEVLRRRHESKQEYSFLMPEYRSDGAGPIFDFDVEGLSFGPATYKKVHYIPSHMLYAYLSVLALYEDRRN